LSGRGDGRARFHFRLAKPSHLTDDHGYCDLVAGRFITRDPIGYAGGINLYAYCQDNPVDNIDPLGLDGGPLDALRAGAGKLRDAATVAACRVVPPAVSVAEGLWANALKSAGRRWANFRANVGAISPVAAVGDVGPNLFRALTSDVEAPLEFPKFKATSGEGLEDEFADWIEKKHRGLSVGRRVKLGIPGIATREFDGVVDNQLAYEVKYQLNEDEVSFSKNTYHFSQQAIVAEHHKLQYWVFFKGRLPMRYAKWFASKGIRFMNLD